MEFAFSCACMSSLWVLWLSPTVHKYDCKVSWGLWIPFMYECVFLYRIWYIFPTNTKLWRLTVPYGVQSRGPVSFIKVWSGPLMAFFLPFTHIWQLFGVQIYGMSCWWILPIYTAPHWPLSVIVCSCLIVNQMQKYWALICIEWKNMELLMILRCKPFCIYQYSLWREEEGL